MRIARYLVVVGVSLVFLLACPFAYGRTITLGSSLATPPEDETVCPSGCTIVPVWIGEPTNLVRSPVNGEIVRWRVARASPGLKPGYAVRVLRGGNELKFKGAGTSAPVKPLSEAVETFPAQLPIQVGDYIGLDVPMNGDIGYYEPTPAMWSEFLTPLADGEEGMAGEGSSERELAFNADVQPAPAVAGLAPASGPVVGGTAVTIMGSDFTGVAAVSFGATPSSSFTIESESRLTAISPPAASPGAVDVSVKTNAGSSPLTGSDRFEYTAVQETVPHCIVPSLKGKKLKAAKKRARKADCKIGHVKKQKGATAKTGKVVRQKPKAGKVKAAGSKIAVTLG